MCLFFAEWRYLWEKCCWVKVFSLVIKLQKYTCKVATVRQGNAKHWFRTTRRSYGKARAEHWFRTPSPIQSRQSNEGGGALHGEFYGGVVAVNSVSLSLSLSQSFTGFRDLGIWFFSFDLRGRGTTTSFPLMLSFFLFFFFFFFFFLIFLILIPKKKRKKEKKKEAKRRCFIHSDDSSNCTVTKPWIDKKLKVRGLNWQK